MAMGGPGMGMGGRQGGMAGGRAGGMMGMMGMMGGMMGGKMGVPDAGEALDDDPYLIVAVVEIESPKSVKLFNAGKPITVKHRWGRSSLVRKSPALEAVLVETAAGKRLPSIHNQFLARHADLLKNPSTDEALKLARWALQNGLIGDFESVMDKLAESDKANSVVAAYLKIKAELAKPPAKTNVAAKWKGKILDGYNVAESDKHHYAILYNSSATDGAKEQLDRLEKSFKGFYYWWALRGITLPLPAERLTAVWTDRGDDFRKLQKNLTASPVLTDSFVARREGLAVFSSKRGDAPYVTLDTSSKSLWTAGFVRNEVIKGARSGIPRGVSEADKQNARIRSLLLKSLEEEWEATGMSHEASRQLLFASKLLPPKVNAPEWLQFGMASFFETPLQSPFGGPGGVSPYWLPRFKEYNKAKRYGSAADALQGVITDAHFRAAPAPGDTHEASLRRARAAAWSLTYFLAQTNLPGLQKYFKELARMPRDIELDAKVLETAFARAFDCVNADRTPNQAKLAGLAGRWVSFMTEQPLEAAAVHKTIRDFYARMSRTPAGARPKGDTGLGATGVLPPE